jgi:hypothetical protein
LFTSEITPNEGVVDEDASISSRSLWIQSAKQLGRHHEQEGGLKQLEEGRCKQDVPKKPMPLNLVQLDIREENFRTKLFY